MYKEPSKAHFTRANMCILHFNLSIYVILEISEQRTAYLQLRYC
jgi:hypothetical protein